MDQPAEPSASPASGSRALGRLRAWLPVGGTLPEPIWRQRHTWIVRTLWVHVAANAAFGLVRGFPIQHLALETGGVGLLAVVAGLRWRSRMVRSVVASVGLMSAAGVLVHLSGGAIEAHFDFFVLIGLLSFYESWQPYLVAIGYVIFHHGLLGTIDPTAVYGHTTTTAEAWGLSAIHGFFVLLMSLVGLAAWRTNESHRLRAMLALEEERDALRLSEAQLREAESRFRTSFVHAPIGMNTVDRKGRFVQVNRAFCELTGYSESELLQRSFLDITHPDDLAVDRQRYDELVAGKVDAYQIEKRLLHAAGHEVWVQRSVAAVETVEGVARIFISQVQDITQRKQSEVMLTHMALHDAVTGLPNRMLLLDRLGQALVREQRESQGVAVLFLDLDRFKFVNDSLGHEVGDGLLRAVAQRLQEIVRPSDTVARIGGDEFVILCEPVPDLSKAHQIAERVSLALGHPFDIEGHEVFASASIGIAVSQGGAVDGDGLLRDADAAMYRAKEQGRNRYEMFEESFRGAMVSRLEMERDLRYAVERGELRLHYQPLVDLATEATVGVEALLRWEHPTRGLIPPLEFIPLAEETGLIVSIGEWVILEACRQARAWIRANPSAAPFKMSVNLSGRQLASPDLADAVARALTETGIDPAQLWLEITESVLTGDIEATARALDGLRALGVRICVDDFGTGYSSLLYLKRFPVDVLKVDRSFVKGLGTDPEDTAIVAGVLRLADTLGLLAVAEGVETSGQLAALKELGCPLAQGFLFARPEPASEQGPASLVTRV